MALKKEGGINVKGRGTWRSWRVRVYIVLISRASSRSAGV